MKADLHVHSHFSDGTYSPEALLRRAINFKISDLAVVDHDTFAGVEKLQAVFEGSPVNYIAGIEISAYDFQRQRKVHLLGYNLQRREYVEALCQPLLEARSENTLQQLKIIQKAGYRISQEAVLKKAQDSTAVYKQHVMAALIDAGYEAEIYGPLYQKLFKNHGIAQRDIEYINVFEAAEAIRQGGGKVVVAHPGQLDSYDLIPELASCGLDGIEKYHPDHTAADHERVQLLADTLQLATYGGSDFHGAYGPDFFGKCAIENVQEFPDTLRLFQEAK
ncbi:PHP domain-containing protein [Enterococcus sp. LJL90]